MSIVKPIDGIKIEYSYKCVRCGHKNKTIVTNKKLFSSVANGSVCYESDHYCFRCGERNWIRLIG